MKSMKRAESFIRISNNIKIQSDILIFCTYNYSAFFNNIQKFEYDRDI